MIVEENKDRVVLRVGGDMFPISRKALLRQEESVLGHLFSVDMLAERRKRQNSNGEFVLDEDVQKWNIKPEVLGAILSSYETGVIPPVFGISRQELAESASRMGLKIKTNNSSTSTPNKQRLIRTAYDLVYDSDLPWEIERGIALFRGHILLNHPNDSETLHHIALGLIRLHKTSEAEAVISRIPCTTDDHVVPMLNSLVKDSKRFNKRIGITVSTMLFTSGMIASIWILKRKPSPLNWFGSIINAVRNIFGKNKSNC